MNKWKVSLAALAAAMLAAGGAGAAGIFPGFPQTGSGGTAPQVPGASYLVPMDTNLPNGQIPQTVLVPLSGMGGNYGGTPRNFLGNGSLDLTQVNGTSTVTCAVNAGLTAAALSADRWGCQANVAVGAGRTAIVTSSPSPPAGFTNVMKVFRTSGALTQPVCVMQEVPSNLSLSLAGNTVTFSFWAAALAGLSADNGNIINAVVITGTGTDEKLTVSPTASPAITPAWTGIATQLNQAINVTTTFARFNVSASIPSTATEIGVMLCFTPTATGAGATDGFAWTGAQLELGAAPSAYEFQPKSAALADSQKYTFAVSEVSAATGGAHAMCMSTTTTNNNCYLQFPTQMYLAPTMTYTAGFAGCTQAACTTLTACSALGAAGGTGPPTATVPLVNGVFIACTTTAVVGSNVLLDNGGSGKIVAWAGL
jgi:hypothetical protein